MKFRIGWRNNGHFTLFRSGTITVVILFGFISNFQARYKVVFRCLLFKISKIGSQVWLYRRIANCTKTNSEAIVQISQWKRVRCRVLLICTCWRGVWSSLVDKMSHWQLECWKIIFAGSPYKHILPSNNFDVLKLWRKKVYVKWYQIKTLTSTDNDVLFFHVI